MRLRIGYQNMMYVFAHTISSRLQYVCNFIFVHHFGVPIAFTTDANEFAQANGAKINYSNRHFEGDIIQIVPVPLLGENHIAPQTIDCFSYNGCTAFFKTSDDRIPFDIFAASFYLLSRYEEYLPFTPDEYGRFPHEDSIAWQQGFLNVPLINIWLQHFQKILQQSFPALQYKQRNFTWLPTYDIDIAYSYAHKGLIKNLGGFIKNPGLDRLQVVWFGKKDPYDCYEWLYKLHDTFDLKPIYFFLAAERNTRYDRQILPTAKAMQKLIAAHAEKYTIGIHPSWQSHKSVATLLAEKITIEKLSSQNIVHSRQHYIKMLLPNTYQVLIEGNVLHDYSMGYGSINGFRASYAGSFYWYNLAKEIETNLCIHPFCFMDANSFFEQKQNVAQTQEEIAYYFKICKQVQGELITIFHNNILGTAAPFKGVAAMYEALVEEISPAV